MSERVDKKFGLVGHPVGHSLSPTLFGSAFRALRVPHSYTLIDAPDREAFRRVVSDMRAGRYAGLNVTSPYKGFALELADEVEDSAELVGAANVLVRTPLGRIVAHNTDEPALVRVIQSLLGDRPPRTAAILGAGGAALAAVVACGKLGFQMIAVTTRSWTHTDELMERPDALAVRRIGGFTALWPGHRAAPPTSKGSMALLVQWPEIASKADLVVQATTAGTLGSDPGEAVAALVPWASVPTTSVALDLVYRPPVTPFLREARARGLTTEGGLSMLALQAAASYKLWTGVEPPVAVMRAAAMAVLSAGAQA